MIDATLVRIRALIDAVPPTVLVAGVLAVAALVVVACGLVATEVLGVVMDDPPDDRIDGRIAAWVFEQRRPGLTSFFRFATHLGDGWFVTLVVIVAAVVLVAGHRPAMAMGVAIATGGTSVVTDVVKDLVDRERPELLIRLAHASGEAFPSGHSSMAVACYGAIAMVVAVCAPRTAVRVAAPLVAAVLALVVGASRVYLGVHWPSDVISGWLVGLAWLTAVGAVSWVLWRVDRPPGWWGRRP